MEIPKSLQGKWLEISQDKKITLEEFNNLKESSPKDCKTENDELEANFIANLESQLDKKGFAKNGSVAISELSFVDEKINGFDSPKIEVIAPKSNKPVTKKELDWAVKFMNKVKNAKDNSTIKQKDYEKYDDIYMRYTNSLLITIPEGWHVVNQENK